MGSSPLETILAFIAVVTPAALSVIVIALLCRPPACWPPSAAVGDGVAGRAARSDRIERDAIGDHRAGGVERDDRADCGQLRARPNDCVAPLIQPVN